MLEPKNQKPTVADYRAACRDANEARLKAVESFEAARAAGDLAGGERIFDELRMTGEALRELRTQLSDSDLLIADFNITIRDGTKVSVVIPEGASLFDLISRTQEITAQQPYGPFLSDETFLSFRRLHAQGFFEKGLFEKEGPTNSLNIDITVEGSENRSRAQQGALLKKHGRVLPDVWDLAAACCAYRVATGTPPHIPNQPGTDLWIRAESGAVLISAARMDLYNHEDDPDGFDFVLAAANLATTDSLGASPGLLKRLYGWFRGST